MLVALAGVVRHNDVRAWTALMALPKMTLRAHTRGGKGHRKRIENDTKQRLRNWLDGHRGQLWERSGRGKSQSSFADEAAAAARKHDRATNLLRETYLQKACSALVQAPPVEVTDDVVREMSAKHPSQRPGELSRLNSLRALAPAAALQAETEAVSKALLSFSRSSGAGPSGLRPQHLKEALAPGYRDEVLRHVTDVVNILARGKLQRASRSGCVVLRLLPFRSLVAA